MDLHGALLAPKLPRHGLPSPVLSHNTPRAPVLLQARLRHQARPRPDRPLPHTLSQPRPHIPSALPLPLQIAPRRGGSRHSVQRAQRLPPRRAPHLRLDSDIPIAAKQRDILATLLGRRRDLGGRLRGQRVPRRNPAQHPAQGHRQRKGQGAGKRTAGAAAALCHPARRSVLDGLLPELLLRMGRVVRLCARGGSDP